MIRNGYSFPKNTCNIGNALHVITYVPKMKTTQQRTFCQCYSGKPKKTTLAF